MAGRVELTTFVGDWSDSLGNNVKAVECASGVQVTLGKSTGRSREIVLTVKKVGTTFNCGHYILDEGESSHAKIVWRDNRFQDRLTVWHRRGDGPGRPDGAVPSPPPPPGVGGVGAVASAPALGAAACGAAVAQPSVGGLPVPTLPQQPLAASEVARQLAQVHAAHAAQAANAQAEQAAQAAQLQAAQLQAAQFQAAQHQMNAQLAHVAQLAQGSQMAATQQAVAQLTAAAQGHAAAGFRHVMPPPPAPLRSAGYSPGQLPSLAHFPAVPQFGQVQQRPMVPPVPVWPQLAGHPGQFAASQLQQRPPAPPAPPRAPIKQPVPESADWSHVLNVLTAVKKEPGDNSTDPLTAVPDSAVPGVRDLPPPAQGEEARWSEVLDLLAAAATADTPAGSAVPQSAPMPAELFGVFGLPSSAPPVAPPSEAEREAVLAETLTRLLREKHGLPQQAPEQSSMPESSVFEGTAGFSSAPWPSVPYGDESSDVPDWQKQAQQAQQTAQLAPLQKMEGPLTKFIRIFGLDELAAECLRKLEDDEAAYVIESCQNRLKQAKNPSAVVMIAIKGVAAKVGRRYYGNKEASALQMALAREGRTGGGANSGLQMFLGSPEPSPSPAREEEEEADAAEDSYADADPYAVINADGDDAEDEGAEVRRAPADVLSSGEPDAKRRKTSEAAVASAEEEEEEEDEEDGDGDALFFVDTGGPGG